MRDTAAHTIDLIDHLKTTGFLKRLNLQSHQKFNLKNFSRLHLNKKIHKV